MRVEHDDGHGTGGGDFLGGVWLGGGFIVGVIVQALKGKCGRYGCGMNGDDITPMLLTWTIWYGSVIALVLLAVAGLILNELRVACKPRCSQCGEKRHTKDCWTRLSPAELSVAMEREAGLAFDGVFLLPGYREPR